MKAPYLRFLPWLLTAACSAPHAASPAVDVGPKVVVERTKAAAPLPLHARLSALMPVGVTSFGAAALGPHVYTLGGYHGLAHAYSKEGQSDAFQRLDVRSGAWESLPSPGPLQSTTLTAFDGKLYRVGGLRVHNAAGEPQHLESLANVERFDPAKGSWEALTPLPGPRSSHATALVGSHLYVVGGWQLNGEPSSGTWDDAIYVTDLAQAQLRWETIPAPLRLRALGVAAVGQRLVTVGGIDERTSSRAVHTFDTDSRRFGTGPEFPEEGFGVRAVAWGGTVLASGSSGVVYALDEAGARWVEVSKLVFRRAFHELVEGPDGTLLALGGIPGMSRVDRIRHIETLSPTPATSPITRFELEAPGAAKNRQGVFLVGSQLYLFGGNSSLGQHDFAPSNFLREGHRLDLGSLDWKPLTSFPVPQQSMQTIVTSTGEGLAVGGFGADEHGQKTRTDVHRFDFDEETWSRVEAGLPEARTQFGLAEHGGKLWVFGGLNFDDARQGDEKFVHPLDVLSADLAQLERGFSDSGVRLPRPRRAHASALLDGRFYLIGGMAAGFASVKECDVFTFETQTWSTIECPARRRIGAELVALDGKLYLAAGRAYGADEKLEPDSSVEIYNPKTGKWSPWLDALPLADSHQMRMLPFGERLLVYTAQRPDARVELLLLDPPER